MGPCVERTDARVLSGDGAVSADLAGADAEFAVLKDEVLQGATLLVKKKKGLPCWK